MMSHTAQIPVPLEFSRALSALPAEFPESHAAALARAVGELVFLRAVIDEAKKHDSELVSRCARKIQAGAAPDTRVAPRLPPGVPGMDCWGLQGSDLVTEYDAKQVEYWLRGMVDKAPPPTNDFERELTMFMAAAAADDPETRAMGIAWGREVLRKQEPIWSAAPQIDGTVHAAKSDVVIDPHRGCALRFDCKLPRNHKGPCQTS